MTKQTEAHLDSRRNEEPHEGGYGDYYLRFNDTEAVERSPFRSTLMALGWLGLTEIVIYHPSKKGNSLESDQTQWILHGMKKIPGSEPMVGLHLGGELTVTATITADGERELDFAFGEGDTVECNADDLNESVWGHLETIHRSFSVGGEGRNLPIITDSPAL